MNIELKKQAENGNKSAMKQLVWITGNANSMKEEIKTKEEFKKMFNELFEE
ncbi:MAG: hypothetical protein LBV64_00905 [Mediterranea sp.]|jgi:hypothetical protein|nr:hypothetical protein [Mediterranea sp.]